jgi:esterase/lipase superfamily enzyme
MSKIATSWYSERVGREVNVARWGEMGTPVLLFPTAAGDAEECERFHMVDALSDLLAEGRIKLYSVDSVAGEVWLKEDNSTQGAARAQHAFDAFIRHELIPAIRTDCEDQEIEMIVAGASIGAFEALSAICRHPDVFRAAICMSGTYDVRKFLEGPTTPEFASASPLHFLGDMAEDEHLARLRERFVLLTHGTGRWEEPEQSWRAADALGSREIPNRVVEWGDEWDHDWPAWRNMLPLYVDELVPAPASANG